MRRTSIGFHTFTIYLRLTIKEAQALFDILLRNSDLYLDDGSNKKRFDDDFINKLHSGLAKYYTFRYRERYKGLSWTLRLNNRSCKFIDGGIADEDKPCSIKATINPKILAGIKDYITAADGSCLYKVIEIFNLEAKKISPLLKSFGEYSLNRNDYCINFDLDDLDIGCTEEQIMELIKQGNIPNHFTELKMYDRESKSHRKVSDKDSFYLMNNSVTINCYNKHHQLDSIHGETNNTEDSFRIIRFEVQCKYLKIHYLLKQLKDIIGLPNIMEEILSDEYCGSIISSYFYKIIRHGDYYTLGEAKKRIVSRSLNKNKETRLIHALELVNESRGIWKAIAKLEGIDLKDFKRSLKDLDYIRVNPVTIPREWKIKHIPNLMTAYYGKIEEERKLNSLNELNEQLLKEYFSDSYR